MKCIEASHKETKLLNSAQTAKAPQAVENSKPLWFPFGLGTELKANSAKDARSHATLRFLATKGSMEC